MSGATSITSYSPPIGSPGTIINIVGSGFITGTVVTLNDISCVLIDISNTLLTCTVPSTIQSSGTYKLVVTNPNLTPLTFPTPFIYSSNNQDYKFTPTNGQYEYPNFPIPPGAISVQIQAVGGGGGGCKPDSDQPIIESNSGGSGAKVVTRSYQLNGIPSFDIFIGGGGNPAIVSKCGGGGGGLTQVQSSYSNIINVIAGGGAGGGYGATTKGHNAGLPNGLTVIDGNYNNMGSGGDTDTYAKNGRGANFNQENNTEIDGFAFTGGGASTAGGGSGGYFIPGGIIDYFGTPPQNPTGGGIGGKGGGGSGGDKVPANSNNGGGGGAGYGGGSGASYRGYFNNFGYASGGGGSIVLYNNIADTSANYTLANNGGGGGIIGGDGYVILQFIYPPPTIESISPSSGGSPTDNVTITGINFLTLPQLPLTVSLVDITAGTANPCTVTSATAMSIQLQVPFIFINGTYNFIVTNNDGQPSAINDFSVFTYNLNPVPTITSIDPSNGIVGSAINISGTNFVYGAIVELDLVLCVARVDNSSNIYIASLPMLENIKDFNKNIFKVTNPGNVCSSPYNFTYYPTPSISSFTPLNGTIYTPITITGTNLICPTARINGIMKYSNSIVFYPPPVTNYDTSYNITITNPEIGGQSAVSTQRFTYNSPPAIDSILPIKGPNNTLVTINGSRFVKGATVAIGTSSSVATTYVSPTKIQFKAPSNINNFYNIIVTNPDLSPSIQTAIVYTYTNPVTITNISLSNTQSGVGNINVTGEVSSVYITGTNFMSGATVTIGTTSLIPTIFTSSTKLSFLVPTNPSTKINTYKVKVTNPFPNSLSATSAKQIVYPKPQARVLFNQSIVYGKMFYKIY